MNKKTDRKNNLNDADLESVRGGVSLPTAEPLPTPLPDVEPLPEPIKINPIVFCW